MNHEIEQILLKNGASMVGFAKIDRLYYKGDFNGPRSEDTATGTINLSHYPIGISILLAHPKEVIREIHNAPTMYTHDNTLIF